MPTKKNPFSTPLKQADPEVFSILQKETTRQQDKLSMIPSENFFSLGVRQAVGSVFMHKYGEGNINQRYYEGCEFIDELEQLTIDRAKKAFNLPKTWSANVQALSGSNANLATYLALIKPGDTILALYLPDGGHLSHGWSYEPNHIEDAENTTYLGGSRKVNLTSKIFNIVQYKTSPKNQLLDYKAIEKIAQEHNPKLIITGGTAYTRLINHKKVKQIAKKVGAYYMADIAHEAGLIAAGVIPSPVGVADVVTMTTHKTLRSGRGAIILSHNDLIKKINRAILPGLQGGPHFHNIAGICVGLGEALTPAYKKYAQQIIDNANHLGEELKKRNFNLVAKGTDKHLLLIDLTNKSLLGKKFARALAYAGIVANFNTMPQETRSPADPSALRLGTPWITTRGMKKPEMTKIARWIDQVMEIAGQWKDMEFSEFDTTAKESPELAQIAKEIKHLCKKFPLK